MIDIAAPEPPSPIKSLNMAISNISRTMQLFKFVELWSLLNSSSRETFVDYYRILSDTFMKFLHNNKKYLNHNYELLF